MARDVISKGPNFIHPEKPSAVGSRNSLNRDGRDEYKEARTVIDEEVDKVLNHINSKLPPEVLEKLDIMGSIKPKLHNYFNQEFQNMFNRYLVTMEDEMAKKFRDLVDKEEYKILDKYSPRSMSELLDRIAGVEKFNTGEIEKSVVNMYGHLQGHIQRGLNEIETSTNALLREKSDVGAFVRGENAYAIVKCSFKDHHKRPKTVQSLKLSINILSAELVSPIYHYQVTVSTIIRDMISKHIHKLIDKEVKGLNVDLLDAGKEELNDSEAIFEKFRLLNNYVDDEDPSVDDSKRYQFLSKKFFDVIEGITAEIDREDYDPLNLRENVKKIVDNENIRNRGFSTAINTLTSILDTSRMGYQYIENFKNARECVIREYEDQNEARLPDERYNIRLVYLDEEQIESAKRAYSFQLAELERNILEIYELCEKIYKHARDRSGKQDWETISNKYLNKSKKKFFDNDEDEQDEKLWDEVSFIEPRETEVLRNNPTYEHKLKNLIERFKIIQQIILKTYGYNITQEREALEKRINFIQESFLQFESMINPYHLSAGLLLDIDIISIKRKRTTMLSMANVLNEFLYTLSKGFLDTAFAEFSRRRSTEKEDLDQSYAVDA